MSTYAFTDCCDGMPVALFEAMSSSSTKLLPSNIFNSAAVEVTEVPLITSWLEASRKAALSAGCVQNIVLVPVPQLTAESLLLDCKIVVLAKVVPDNV